MVTLIVVFQTFQSYNGGLSVSLLVHKYHINKDDSIYKCKTQQIWLLRKSKILNFHKQRNTMISYSWYLGKNSMLFLELLKVSGKNIILEERHILLWLKK